MGASAQYKDAKFYEARLKGLMKRLGISENDFDWNHDRHGAWIDFKCKGKYSRFEQSIANAAARGEKLSCGSDCFAQLVLTLGDLERAMRKGIYTFDMFVRGLPMLNAPSPNSPLPDWADVLQFTDMPRSAEEVNDQYRQLAKQMHPDSGGTVEAMKALNLARDEALKWAEGLRK